MNEQNAGIESRPVLKRKSAEERKQLVRECEASGKSQQEFCDERGIKLTTFKSWYYEKKAAAEPGFAEVAVAMLDAGPVEVIFPSGVRVSIRGTGSREELVELVRGVAGC
jgi:transposase-like protein